MHFHIHIYTYTHIHTYIHTYVRTALTARTYIHTHTYANTHCPGVDAGWVSSMFRAWSSAIQDFIKQHCIYNATQLGSLKTCRYICTSLL